MTRPATANDAIDAIDAIRQSITILCEADHHNDAATLDRWLANKKPDSFKTWIADPDNYCVVEEAGGRVQGVGLLRRNGELQLFYVAPGHERRGIGRKIHEALMSQAKHWGLTKVHLESTSVARCFYESLGYRYTGAEKFFRGLQVFPYEKTLDIAARDIDAR
jgi:GNAT superfamily N-acetyltransferase